MAGGKKEGLAVKTLSNLWQMCYYICMKICLYKNVTSFDAVKAMFSAIDNSDFEVEHVVIVPDRFSLLSEKLLLQLLSSKALFNVRVENLTSFSVELLGKLGVKLDEVLSSGEVLLLTQKAIENVKNQLSTFKKSRIAFSYEISKLLSQFKSSGVRADDLNENAAGIAGAKYHDLKLIYSEYQRLLADKLDANERLALLNNSLKEGEFLANTKLYFAGFDAFTKEGYSLIKKLVPLAKEVSFSLAESFDSGNEYIYDNDISEMIKQIAYENGCMVEAVEGKKEFSKQKEGLLKGVYSYHKASCENDGFYNLYSASNITEEVESVCKLIRYKIYKKGLRFHDFQVAVGDLERYQTQIEDIFDRYDIPYYIDSGQTCDQTMLGRLVLDFLEGVSFGFYGERLINILSNILLGENQELIERCQRLVIDSKRKYKKYIERDFPFADLALSLERCKNVKQYGEKILEFVGRVLSPFDEVVRLLEERGDIKEKNINLQAFDILKETIDLIGRYDDGEIEIDEYARKLKLLLSFRQVSTVPTYVDGVMIGDASKSFFGESDTLIIMGGQALPITNLDNGILSDDELLSNIKEIEPTIRMINRRNRFRLFSLLPLGQNQLYIFFQSRSDDGKKIEIPSYIASLNNIFSQVDLKVSSVFFARKPRDEERALLCHEFKKIKGNLLKNGEKTFKNREKLNFDGKKLMFKDNIVRVTQLEQFYSCPFKHFVSYGLNLGEIKNVEFDPRDIGNICHKGAEKFIKELIKNGFDFEIDIDRFIESRLGKIIEEEHLNEKLDLLDEKEPFVRFIKRQLKANFNDIIRELKKSSFRPKFIEKRFADYKLNVGGEEFLLIGRADRIDEQGDYVRIIDYKTGNTGSVLKQLYFGDKLQLFLYQKIACEQFEKRSAGGYYFNAKLDYSNSDDDKVILKGIAPNDEEVLCMLDSDLAIENKSNILSVERTSKGFKGGAICDESLENLYEYSMEISKKAIEKIANGFVRPMPNSESCTYCKYSALCGSEK